jgi:hypothetical protein
MRAQWSDLRRVLLSSTVVLSMAGGTFASILFAPFSATLDRPARFERAPVETSRIQLPQTLGAPFLLRVRSTRTVSEQVGWWFLVHNHKQDTWHTLPDYGRGDFEYARDWVVELNRIECGWPRRSFYAQTWGAGTPVPPGGGGGAVQISTAYLPWAKGRSTVDIPIVPMLGNATFNAAVWSLPLVAIVILTQYARILRRRLRGLCLRCAYPLLSHSARCPECGHVSLAMDQPAHPPESCS